SSEQNRRPGDLIDQPLRILVLDDAIATAHTAESILTTLLTEVKNTYRKFGRRMESAARVIEWIRYFAVLNQMSGAHHILWHNLPLIGRTTKIPVVFEEFAPFMGVPVYDADSCPICRSRLRLRRLIAKCGGQEIFESSHRWAMHRAEEIR